MLTELQIERYSRQILVPRVGGRGQQRLLDARIAVMLCDEIADPAIAYLAAAGIGDLVVYTISSRRHPSSTEGLPEHPDCRIHRCVDGVAADPDTTTHPAADVLLCEASAHRPSPELARATRPDTTPVVLLAVHESRIIQGILQGTLRTGQGEPCLNCAWRQIITASRTPTAMNTIAGLAEVTQATAGSLLAYTAIDILLGADAPARLDIDLRTANVTQRAWASCSGADEEAVVSGCACIAAPKRP